LGQENLIPKSVKNFFYGLLILLHTTKRLENKVLPGTDRWKVISRRRELRQEKKERLNPSRLGRSIQVDPGAMTDAEINWSQPLPIREVNSSDTYIIWHIYMLGVSTPPD
jgi:hypothetical protein